MKNMNLIFRIALTLIVLGSLGMVFTAPVAASPALTLDVNAWTKSELGVISELKGCIEPESEFLINAGVTAGLVNCDNVVACIGVSGPVRLDPRESPAPTFKVNEPAASPISVPAASDETPPASAVNWPVLTGVILAVVIISAIIILVARRRAY